MEFKTVKNATHPGRPPRGCKWAKDAEGNFIRNAEGQFGFEELTEADLAARSAPKTRVGKKRGSSKVKVPRASKTSIVVDDSVKSILLSKGTYKQLSASELVKIQSFITGLMDSAKANEKKALEKAIAKFQDKLNKLG